MRLTSEIEISDTIIEAAEEENKGYLDTAHLFDYDSISPAHGTQFPANPAEGDFFVRTDFTPNRLYTRRAGVWEFTSIE